MKAFTSMAGWKDRSVFLLLTVILLAFIAALFLYDYRVRKENLEEKSYHYMKNHERAYSSFSLFSEQINALYRQLLLNRDISQWLNHPGELTLDMYRLSQIQSSFIGLINSHSGLDSIYLHNTKNNLVLSTSFMLSELEQFPNRSVFQHFYDSGFLNSWQQSGPEFKRTASGSSVLSLVQSIPSRGGNGTVTLNFSQHYIADKVMNGNDYLLWLDENNRVLIANNEQSEQFFYEHADSILAMQQPSAFYKEHLVITSDAATGGWKLLTILPEKMLLTESSGVSLVKYLILVLAAALGALLTFYFRYVRREQEKLFAGKLQRNLDDFRKGVVTDLLNGKPLLPDLEQKAAEYNMDLSGEQFQVVVFEIDDYYNFLLSKTNPEYSFMNKIVFNAIHWTFALKFNAYIVHTELEKVAILLCHKESGQETAGKLEETIRYIQQDIKEHIGLTVCAGISDTVEDLSLVHRCYTHALWAVDYKTVYGKQAIIYYNNISIPRSSSYYRFPNEIKKMNDYLKEGRLDKIEQALETILEEMIASENFTLEWIHAIFAQILSSIMKFVIEHRLDLNQLCKEDVFITLYSYEFLEEKKAYVIKICRLLLETVESRSEQPNVTAKAIVDYIDKHYDKPISLSIMANKLSMSPSYLSVAIKNHLGIGFVEYINKLRIQKAHSLLENDELTIQKIAEDCGYDTVHTFIRHFKKMYQLPPNEYRNKRKTQSFI